MTKFANPKKYLECEDNREEDEYSDYYIMVESKFKCMPERDRL